MAHAQCAINSNFSTTKNEFYVTASPALRKLSIAGCRYSVINECVSRSLGDDSKVVDLRGYDHIVFIGQFLQPKRLFRSGEIHTKSVTTQLIRACGYPVYQPGNFYNEPLELFPRLAPGRCTIFCDPLPIFGIYPSSIEVFLDEVGQFCNKNAIKFVIQPEHTLDGFMQTLSVYKRTKSTSTHFNEAFWQICIAHVKRSLVMAP